MPLHIPFPAFASAECGCIGVSSVPGTSPVSQYILFSGQCAKYCDKVSTSLLFLSQFKLRLAKSEALTNFLAEITYSSEKVSTTSRIAHF